MEEQQYIDELIAAGATDDEIVEALAEFRKRATVAPQQPTQQGASGPFFRFLEEDKDKPWYNRRFVPTNRFNELIDTPSSVIGQFGRTIYESLLADPLKLAGVVSSEAGSVMTGAPVVPEQNPLYRAGESVENFIEGQTYVNPEKEGSFPVQVAGGLGTAATIVSTGGFSGFTKAAGGWAPKLLNYGKQALGKMIGPAGVVAGAMTAVPEYEAAREAGQSEEDAFKVLLLNYGVGQTDIIPLSNMMGRLNTATGGGLIQTLKNMGKGGIEEALQETFQTYLTNEVAKGSYDPDRDPLVGLAEAAGLGAFIGALIPGGGAIAQRAIAKSQIDETIGMVADTENPALNTEIDDQAEQVIQNITTAKGELETVQPVETFTEPEQGQKVNENAPVEESRASDAPVSIPQSQTDPAQLAQEFNEAGTLLGQTEEAKKPAMAESVADFLRQKGVTSQEGVDSFVDAWNELPVEGKPVLKIADAKRIGELVVTKPTTAPKETIILTFQQAVQDLNRAMEKGIRKGQKLVNENLIPKVQEALKEANMSPRQTSTILTKLRNTNLFTPGSYSKLNTFIEKVVNDAQYAEKIAQGKSLQKRIKKFGRQKAEKIPVNYKVIARQFGKINPTELQNIDEYLEKAESVIGGFRPVENERYRAINVSDAEDYIDKVLSTQEEEQEKVIDESPNDSSELRAIAQASIERLKAKDLSGFDQREKTIVEQLRDIDVSQLAGGELVQSNEQDQLKRLIKIVDNVNENDDLSGEAFIENIAAVRKFVNDFTSLQKAEGGKISEIGAWGRTMYNVSNMVKRLFQNETLEASFRSFVHGPILRAGSQTEKAVVDASQGFDKKLKELNSRYQKELRNIDNKADMMVFSLMYQMDSEVDMAKIHRNIKETIRRNREVGNENEAKAWEESYDHFKNVTTADQAKNIIKAKNPAVYEMWKFFGNDELSKKGIFTDELASEQAQVAKEVYNREYAPTVRYTPIVQHDVNTLYKIAETISEGGPAMRQTIIKPSQARTAKRRTLNLAPNKVYTLEPYTDWILRYGETVYDNKASKAEARMAELLMSPEFTKMVGGNENAVSLGDAYKRMVSIQRGTNRLIADNEAENFFTELAKTFRSIGTVKALASASQVVKQSTVSVKTLSNLISTGDVDLVVPAYHAIKSLRTNPENNPVEKLLNQSTLIARGLRLGGTDRGTSEAYKLQRSATRWLYKILEDSRTTIDKRTRASLSLLVKPDIFNARLAFVSYYLQGLRQQGVTDVDMNTEYKRQEEPQRKQAMAYAENMVEKTQTASNPAAMSAIQAQTQSKGWEFVKTVFLPFSTFDADFKARLTNEVSAVRRSGSTENIVKLGGTISEAVAFAALNAFLLYYYKEFLKDAIRLVTGSDEPEKTDEQIEKQKSQQFLSSISSALNPLAIGTIPQEAQSKIINEIGFLTANPENLSKHDWLRKNALVYEPREGSLIENLGAYSTGISPIQELIETLPKYKAIVDQPIKITDAYGNEKTITLTNEQKSILLLKGIAESLTLAGITEADVANAIRAVYKEQMKNGEYAPVERTPNKKEQKRQFE